ncbi:rod shape-determining protein MreD [Ferviditalea candida]|uniref:Rod shape-determining protein MreD n=1 Tax=Ferviditalea candida TaxID=3108399 RepID=A0ABU5ZCZ4_9BACL|nr:rod shape-determining protein MreD [Paenibacillaceae bacterium T2]
MRYPQTLLILLLFFLVEGSLFPWLLPSGWSGKAEISPHFVLIGIIYIAIYRNRHAALVYGLLFGFLQDLIYYGHMLGVHSFSMGLLGYLVGLSFARKRSSLLLTLSFTALAELAYGIMLYGIYRFFNVTDLPLTWILLKNIFPSLLLNLLFGLIIYVPARQFLEGSLRMKQDEEMSVG